MGQAGRAGSALGSPTHRLVPPHRGLAFQQTHKTEPHGAHFLFKIMFSLQLPWLFCHCCSSDARR